MTRPTPETLETFFPVAEMVTIAGVEVAIPPLRMRQIPAFQAATTDILPMVVVGDYLGVVSQHSAAVIDAIAIATGLERDWMRELTRDEMMRLTAAVFEAHIGFFDQCLFPLQAELAGRMQALMGRVAATVQTQAAGALASPFSSAPDTALSNAAT